MNDPRPVGADNRASGTAQPDLAARFRTVRARTLQLAQPLSEEDCCVQSMPDASPVKWHLAHTTWFFETFVLEPHEAGFRPHAPAFRVLFNSYYNGVGEKHPRPQRGMLTRPSLAEVKAYREAVDTRMLSLLAAQPAQSAIATLVELGLHHEQQHQELIVTDVKHLLSLNPIAPAYEAGAARPATDGELRWVGFAGGLVEAGHDGEGFCFDNETPRHRQYLQPFTLASRLATNAEFLRFIDDGGYARPELWLSEGWDWVRTGSIGHPLYWRRDEGAWYEFTLAGKVALDPQAPVVHLSYFEADAFARWSGARLPTEFEWEHAASHDALRQLFGHAWQWTQSSYAPYPGYRPPGGAIGEYNGKFMVNQYVLRGSSGATPEGHARPTYRNFFPASARWQLTGVRLARDGSAHLLD
jgi:ergothioneine biosynthesis protein EgtB